MLFLMKCPPAAMSKEKVLFFAGWVIEQLTCPFGLFFFRVLSGFSNKALSTCRWQKLWVRKRQKKLAPVSRALQGHVTQKNFKI